MTEIEQIKRQMQTISEFNDSLYSNEEKAVFAKLRARGCVVAILAPEEIGKAPAEMVEEAMVLAAWSEIDYYKDHNAV
jgi:hypothetical protein